MEKILDRKKIKNYIERYELEKILTPKMLENAQLHIFSEEEVILQADFDLEYYYIIVDGTVKVSYLMENGKSVVLKFYSAINSLGDMEIYQRMPIRCDVHAVEGAKLIAVPVATIYDEGFEDRAFLKYLVESLSEKLYATLNNSSYNLTYPMVNRLSSFLMEQTRTRGNVELKMSFNEIAQFLGATYRHLNRTFKMLEADGLIKVRGKTVEIIDEDRLGELSKTPFIKSL